MWHRTAGVVLAVAIGLFLYRAALVAVPIEQYVGTPSMICREGNVPRPLFDLWTGLPGGVAVSCANSEGEAGVLWGPMEVSYLGGHWVRSVLFGFAATALALTVLWWGARRRRSGVDHGGDALSSA